MKSSCWLRSVSRVWCHELWSWTYVDVCLARTGQDWRQWLQDHLSCESSQTEDSQPQYCIRHKGSNKITGKGVFHLAKIPAKLSLVYLCKSLYNKLKIKSDRKGSFGCARCVQAWDCWIYVNVIKDRNKQLDVYWHYAVSTRPIGPHEPTHLLFPSL